MMIELLGSLGQYQVIPILPFLDRHQNSGQSVVIAGQILGRSILEGARDPVGNHD
jgi:hypothetical protein